jgi:predicted DNA-binding antitoxin AbrB/MazE fold protein
MPEQIDAIYDAGVLKPIVPLSLPDKTQVKLTIEPQAIHEAVLAPQDEWERRLLAVAKDCNLSLPDSAFAGEELYS